MLSTGLHRKHAIKALNNFVEKQHSYESRGRKKIYNDPILILTKRQTGQIKKLNTILLF